MATAVITGDKALNRKLHRLASKEQKKAFRNAARPAIKPVMVDARKLAPSDKKDLSRSVKVRSQKRSRSSIGVRVTTRAEDVKNRTYHGAFQNFGWKAGVANRQIEGTEFMNKAADRNQNAVLRDYRGRLKNEIERSAKRD